MKELHGLCSPQLGGQQKLDLLESDRSQEGTQTFDERVTWLHSTSHKFEKQLHTSNVSFSETMAWTGTCLYL